MHYDLTYLLLIVRGWPDSEATQIAQADAAIDSDRATNPVQLGALVFLNHRGGRSRDENAAADRLGKYHFPGSGPNDATDRNNRVLIETLPQTGKPIQAMAYNGALRSIHGTSYTRLYNAELDRMLGPQYQRNWHVLSLDFTSSTTWPAECTDAVCAFHSRT